MRTPEQKRQAAERAKQWRLANREKDLANKREYYKAHREEFLARAKAWNNANPERVKENHRRHHLENKRAHREARLRQVFGIGIDDYDRMLELQRGGCAICGRKSVGHKGRRHFHVDHDHRTGKVRGLLCHRCNAGLGAFKDDPERLRKAAAYLGG